MKTPNSWRFKNLPKFKGILSFTKKSTERCAVYKDEKIVGIGYILTGGKDFRVLFNSDGQKGYAHIVQERCGRVGIKGYYQGDNVYSTGIFYPPSRSRQAKTLHRIREAKQLTEGLPDQILTGHQRSHETYIPIAAKALQIKLQKKEPEMKIKKPRKEKSEKSDFELEQEKERRVEQLASFKYVRKQLDTAGLRLALIEMKYTVPEIETACKMLDVSVAYMSHRAYR